MSDSSIVIDCGAEGHMTPDKKWLENYKDSEFDHDVVIDDNGKLTVACKGGIRLSSNNTTDRMSDL